MKNTNDDLFLRLYHEVWNRPKIYYSTRRQLNTCIVYGNERRFFLSIRDCVSWAVRNGLIRDPAKVIEEAEAEAAYLERLDDQMIDKADAQYRLNQRLNEVGDTREIARLIRKSRDRWIL